MDASIALFVEAGFALRPDGRFFFLRVLKNGYSSNTIFMQALIFRKFQRRGMKQLLDGQLFTGQALFMRVLKQ